MSTFTYGILQLLHVFCRDWLKLDFFEKKLEYCNELNKFKLYLTKYNFIAEV